MVRTRGTKSSELSRRTKRVDFDDSSVWVLNCLTSEDLSYVFVKLSFVKTFA